MVWIKQFRYDLLFNAIWELLLWLVKHPFQGASMSSTAPTIGAVIEQSPWYVTGAVYVVWILILYAAFLFTANVLDRMGLLSGKPPRLEFLDFVDHCPDIENQSWFHLPIRIKRRWPWQWKEIEECTVSAYFDGIDPDGGGVPMHWQSKAGFHDDGIPEMTLRVGREYRIPLIERGIPASWYLTGHTHDAYLTDAKFMRERAIEPNWFPKDTVRYIEIRVRSASGVKWSSRTRGKIKVQIPAHGEGNTRFIVDWLPD